MDDHPKIRIVPPAKVHGNSGVTSVFADSTLKKDGEVEAASPADKRDNELDETLAGGLRFPKGT